MLLEGIFIPLTTPFYPDGRVYLKKLEHNVDCYSRTSAAGMLVLGDTGEGGSLTDEESRRILHTAIAAAAKTKVMIADVSRPSVFATLDLAETALMAAYDVLALTPPPAADRTELLTYFRAIADRAPLPVLILSKNGQLPAELLAELASHPQILGAIDGHASPARIETIRQRTAGLSREVVVTPVFAAATARMLEPTPSPTAAGFVSAESLTGAATAVAAPIHTAIRTRTRRVGFQVLAGSGTRMLESWHAGAAGAVLPLAAAAPQACCEVWQAFKDGDPALAAEKQDRIHIAATLTAGRHGIGALKHGCDLNGYFGGRPRLPLVPPTATQREELERALAGMRN